MFCINETRRRSGGYRIMIYFEEQDPANRQCFRRALEAYYNTTFDHWYIDYINTALADILLTQLGFCVPYKDVTELTPNMYVRNRNYICVYFNPPNKEGKDATAHAICVNDINFCTIANIHTHRLYFPRKGNIFQRIWWRMQRVRLLGK